MASKAFIPKKVINIGEITAAADNPASPVPTPAPSPAIRHIIIFKNIYNLAKQEKTVIFVSHRMGSTFYSNNTIVLDNGMIVENDNYKYLLNKDGLYAKMYNLQAKYYK